MRGVVYQDNQICVKKVLNQMYWSANKKTIPPSKHTELTKIYIGLAIIIVAMRLMGVFLAIRWCRRRKNERNEEENSTLRLNPTNA